MSLEQKQKFIDEYKKNNKLGTELLDKKEFQILLNQLFNKEKLHGLIICEIEGQIWLVGISNQRLILVRKSTIYGSEIKQIGLENIFDLKIKTHGSLGELNFILFSGLDLKLETIKYDLAKEFGMICVQMIKEWNNNLIGYLI